MKKILAPLDVYVRDPLGVISPPLMKRGKVYQVITTLMVVKQLF